MHLSIERKIRILAGSFILISLALAMTMSIWFLLFTAFVGVNLIQSSLTGFCPAEMIFKALEKKPTKTA